MPKGGPREAIWAARAEWWARAEDSEGVRGRESWWEMSWRRVWMERESLVGV